GCGKGGMYKEGMHNKHYSSRGITSIEAKRIALEEAILGGRDDNITTTAATSLVHLIVVEGDNEDTGLCELKLYGMDNGACSLYYEYTPPDGYVLSRIRCVDDISGKSYNGDIDGITSELSHFNGIINDCEILSTVINKYLSLRKPAIGDLRLMTLIGQAAASNGYDTKDGELCGIEISSSGPTYAILKKVNDDDEVGGGGGWVVKYMIVQDYIFNDYISNRLPHLTLRPSFIDTLRTKSASTSLTCSQLRLLLNKDEEYVIPWIGLTDEEVPIAQAIEYYNIVKLLPKHNKDASFKLLRKAHVSKDKAEAITLGLSDDERAIIANNIGDNIHDMTGYIIPLLTRFIQVSDIPYNNGCRFDIRSAGLEFTISSSSSSSSYTLNGVYCKGDDIRALDNTASAFLKGFFGKSSRHHRQGPLLDELKKDATCNEAAHPAINVTTQCMTQEGEGGGEDNNDA
ncbi:hypothetical protein FOL47_009121, partial [Perkinsus chesapeaki]